MMKLIKKTTVFCILFSLLPMIMIAQTANQIVVKAIIKDEQGKPIDGAKINVEKQKNDITTNSNGSFIIEASSEATVKISAKGYKTKYLQVSEAGTEIVLNVDNSDDLVQVAFQKVDKKDLLGGVSAVNVKEVIDKNYFTYSLDAMDAFASGFNGNIWGMSNYLLLIDGVPRDVGNVLPTEIDQITFLKGASAVALYGSRAANGVVYITTKRGGAHEQKINIRANSGLHVPKAYAEYLGSAEYMTLYNEARANDGLTSLYSDETIYNYASGKNKYRYPNVNYYSDEYLKKSFGRHDVTAEIHGGGNKAKYYTNLGYNTSGSLINFGESIKDRTDRFNIRGNIDMNLNDYISAKVDATAIFYSGRGANANYWGSAATLRPYRFTPLIPISMIEDEDENSLLLANNSNYIINGQYLLGGTQLDQTNPFASTYAGGYNTYNSRQFQFNSGVTADLRNVLEGLSFTTNLGVDYSNTYNQSFNNNYAVYQASWTNYAGEDLIAGLTKYGQDSKTGQQNISNSWYRQTIALSGQFNYKNVFQDKHYLSGIFVANGYQQSTSAVYHKVSNANLGLQLGYNFKQKYYADFSGAFIHSARLPKNNRQAFSPTLSLGWRLSEEDFLANSSVINDLKITASAGILHTDINVTDYYLYESIFRQTDGAWFGWRDGTGVQSTDSRRGDNPNLTFPKRKDISLGFESSLFNNVLNVGGNFFITESTGNVIQASVLYPNYFSTVWPNSSFIPYVNYNNDKRTGFDFNLNVNKRTGNINWIFGTALTYINTKATKRAEVYEDDYQYRQGKPLDALWGLQNLGFFNDQADIDNSPEQTYGEVKPGDIKYKDQNGDGIIDSRDEVYLGKAGWYGSPFSLGLHITAKWKNITFFALGTGRVGAYGMKNSSYFWVDGEDKYSAVVRDRWTEATKSTATYPRLTTNNSDNNFRSSDFWLYKSNRFDLSKVQISYDLPKNVMKSKFLHELGFYVSGFNLLTISKERELMEMNVGSAPQTRLYNLGVKALF